MEEKAARGRKEKEVMLGVMGLGGGGEKKPWEPGSERQKLHPGIALLALHGLWVKQWWEKGAEAVAILEKRRIAPCGRKKVTTGSCRWIITIMICKC